MAGQNDGNKTELPTEKRLEDAQKEGNFRFSEAVVSFSTTFFGLLFAYMILQSVPDRFERSLSAALFLGQQEHFALAVQGFLLALLKEFLPPVAMVFGVAIIVGWSSNMVQTGIVFQGSKFTKGIEAVNPVNNVKNLFSKQSLTNLGMMIVKTAIICFTSYSMLKDDVTLVDRIYACRGDVLCGLGIGGTTIFKIILMSLVVMIPLIAVDFGLRHLFYIKDNMMSKDELKREHKETEGDPEVKAHRKSMGKELVMGENNRFRLDAASAILRNPTHYAVAVRYEPTLSLTPYIVDMGADDEALQIIELARELKIPMYENVAYTRAIYAQCQVNDPIPLELAEQTVPFLNWLRSNHPERVYEVSEFKSIGGDIGHVKR